VAPKAVGSNMDAQIYQRTPGPKNRFCVPTDDLLRAKEDLLSEGGQSLSSLTEQA